MDLNVECEKFALRVIKLVERNVSRGLRGHVQSALPTVSGAWVTSATGRRPRGKRRKAKRARIRCRACNRVGHNARNPRCPAKAKRAALHVVAGKKAA